MTRDVTWHHGDVSPTDRAQVTGGEGVTIWLTGLSGSGKSTVAHAVEDALIRAGRAAYVLDGDNLRHGLNRDLGFTAEERTENVRRVSEVARLMADAGMVVLVPVISPYRQDRATARMIHEAVGIRFVEVFVDAPIEVCEMRDPKGLYRRARAGEISGLTGIDSPYEPPESADLVLDTARLDVAACVRSVLTLL